MQRIQSLDLARGFTVLFIPAIHSVMLYSKPEVYTSWLGYFLTFIAEGPGGQLFMLIMGIVFTFKTRHTTSSILIRSMALLVAGYLLNILKFIVPYSLDFLPTGMYRDLQLSKGEEWLQLLLLGDILHFAAIALIIIHLAYRVKNYWFWCIAMALIIFLLAPLAWDLNAENHIIDYMLQLFGGQPPRVFFPVLPWLIYPLAGLTIGYFLKKNQQRTFTKMAWIGWVFILSGFAITKFTGQDSPVGFYRSYPGETLAHLGVVLVALHIWDCASTKVKSNYFFQLINWCSKNITNIYIIQWILICWLVTLFGYQTLELFMSLIICLITSIITLSICYLLNRSKFISHK